MKMLTKWMSGSGLKARAARSTMLTIFSFGGENALRLGGNLILTRLLFPEAFGLMALIHVVMTGLLMFSDLGLRAAIIQNERSFEPSFLNTAWTIQIVRGTILWLATWLLAAPVAGFYDEPDLAAMLPVAGLTAVIAGFESTRLATASRDLTLGRLTALALGSQAVGLGITIALTFWYQSVWALVFGGLIAPFVKTLLSHIVLPGNKDRIELEMSAAGQLIRFGRYILVSTFAGFLLLDSDRAILGKFVSLGDLALYNIALFMATVPILLITRVSSEILFPVLSRSPAGKMGETVAQITRERTLMNVLTVLLSTVFVFIGDHLIVLLYDPRYEAAGYLLVLIALAQFPLIIEVSYGPMPLAAGHSGRFAVYVTTNALIRVLLLYLGARYFGIIGVVFAPTAGFLITYPFLLVFLRRYHHMNVRADIISALFMLAMAALAIWFKAETFTQAFIRFGNS